MRMKRAELRRERISTNSVPTFDRGCRPALRLFNKLRPPSLKAATVAAKLLADSDLRQRFLISGSGAAPRIPALRLAEAFPQPTLLGQLHGRPHRPERRH